MAYIDTKYLFKCETCRNHRSGKCDTWCDHGEEYIPDMNNIPTADVEEVKHGYWKGKQFDWDGDYPILEESHYLVCNECGYKHFLYIYDFFGKLHKCSTSDIPIIIPNGCPNCLAKMDGGKAE